MVHAYGSHTNIDNGRVVSKFITRALRGAHLDEVQKHLKLSYVDNDLDVIGNDQRANM